MVIDTRDELHQVTQVGKRSTTEIKPLVNKIKFKKTLSIRKYHI